MQRTLARLVPLAGFVMLIAPRGMSAQGAELSSLDREASDAAMTAVLYLFAADSLPSVSWPSPKTLLARRAGAVALAGISTRRGEDPAKAIALTDRVVAALNEKGVRSQAVSRVSTQGYCGRGNSATCTLPGEIALLILVGHPTMSATQRVAQITLVADSAILPGRPVLSLDVVMQQVDGVWRVVTVKRTAGAA